jgi:hypothetical protein
MKLLKGNCMCGAVRYEIKAEPQLSFICQCRDCQKITGSGHSAEFAVPIEAVSISGELKHYKIESARGSTVNSYFCPICGNPVYKKTSGYSGLFFFHAATLEKPELFQPQQVFWASSSQPWDCVDPKLEVKENQ